VVDGAIFDNLKHILVDAMVLFGDLNQDNIASKLIIFRANGVNVFQGVRIGVAIQLKNQNAPFMISVHCTSHCINLAVKLFPSLALWEKLKMCYRTFLYTYFSRNPKRTQEFIELANIMEIGNQWILKNIKTCWIPMLS
jgi:hypothetical protein